MTEPAAMVTRRIIVTEEMDDDGERTLSFTTEPADQLMKWDVLGMLRHATLMVERVILNG